MLTSSPAWQALQSHQPLVASQHLRDLFDTDAGRAQRYKIAACGLTLDYSKNLIDDRAIELLVELAEQQGVTEKRTAMFAGERINHTENRSVLHTALRSPVDTLEVDGDNVMPGVHTVLNRIEGFVDAVHSGSHAGYTGKRIQNIVNIGIGGSDLGPKMVVTALTKQLAANAPSVHFVSNIDDAHFAEVTRHLDPDTTLFVIASKTFTTQETMLNATTAREWFIERTGGRGDIAKHFVAVSTAFEETRKFGIDDANVFEFWDWVGGRYSLWSAIGLPIALSIGMAGFRRLLAGAHAMDQHFCVAPLAENLPVILALLGVWYINFFDAKQHLILPYSYPLREFAPYIQQLDMESNGKSVDIDGRYVDYATGPAIWGGLGSNAQHAFYQLIHQGQAFLPADFIVARDSGNGEHAPSLASNFIG
ncbi:MAG: glucose-6-phosphate isomerase, partial [Pseudomonadota bacterium]